MSRRRPGALPVFWQTLALLLLGLLIAQAIGIALLLLVPPPRPDFNRLPDVAAALGAAPPAERDPRAHGAREHEQEERERELHPRLQPAPPAPPRGLVADPTFTHDLALRLAVPDAAVRLYYQPEKHPAFPFARRPGWVPIRRHEPIFFGRLVAGVATPHGWRVAETAPPPLVAPWQRRLILWFAAGALALVPLAWAFARALSRQIRRFADAADRLGTDPLAPPVAEVGPAELRVAARALNRMQARLAEHLGERTAMIGAIAHDLRTPLARIAFRVEGAPEPMREKVLADVDQMQAMISATMGFVRHAGTPGARTPLDLAGLLAAIVEQDRDLGRDVTLTDAPAATVLGDPLALERLIQNLIDNGLAYGGGAVEVSLELAGDAVLLRVADRGPGLAPELLERVFQPFARGDPSRNRETGGIGLGLTIARTVAEDHGGGLTLANRDGGGLEAVVRLPVLG